MMARDYPLDSDFNDPMPEDTVTQTLSIFGPNLSGLAQKKGTFHVHDTACGDCAHYGPRGKFGGERGGWDVTADTIAAVVMEIYADVMTDDPEQASANWGTYVNDIWFAPCVTLPDGLPFNGDDPIHWVMPVPARGQDALWLSHDEALFLRDGIDVQLIALAERGSDLPEPFLHRYTTLIALRAKLSAMTD